MPRLPLRVAQLCACLPILQQASREGPAPLRCQAVLRQLPQQLSVVQAGQLDIVDVQALELGIRLLRQFGAHAACKPVAQETLNPQI